VLPQTSQPTKPKPKNKISFKDIEKKRVFRGDSFKGLSSAEDENKDVIAIKEESKKNYQ